MKAIYSALKTTTVIGYLFLFCSSALAQSAEEKDFLAMYFSEDQLVVQTPTRSPQPLSHVAENITVVTAAEIERMNAHTLADVLDTIPGVSVWLSGGPGQKAQASILGSFEWHMTVIMDGVILNGLWSGIAEIGMIPVQNIQKIEIIKGPASSAWGSALGGVVNIITKTGISFDQGGTLYASIGGKSFGDFRAEARGKQDRLGYYLTAGRLQSDGLTPHLSVSAQNAYAKLSYDIADNTDILFALNYASSRRDDYYNYFSPFPWAESGDSRYRNFHSTLGVNSALAENIDLNLFVWSKNHYTNDGMTDLITGSTTYGKDRDDGYGASARLTWKTGRQTLVVGTDSSNMTDEKYVLPNGKQSVRKRAAYANDTLSVGRLTVTPGIRFDYTNSNGDITSPSLGITYGLQNSTILRAYAARGFSIPQTGQTFGIPLYGYVGNPDLAMETVWSYQAGVETAAFNHLWFKFSAFRNDIRNVIDYVVLGTGDVQSQNVGRERREGIVIETKTKPVYNTSILAAAEFITAEDVDTGETVRGVPVQVYDIGVRYDDRTSLIVQLQGRHINWNVDMSSYDSMLLDLNVIKKLFERNNGALEVFVNAHNLLNTAQYQSPLYPNPERWYEGGVRYRF